MEQYEGLTLQDLKVIQIALQKLPITGVEAPMMVKLQKKIEMEIDFISSGAEKPKVGDVIIKE